jgi:hypothetical protein
VLMNMSRIVQQRGEENPGTGSAHRHFLGFNCLSFLIKKPAEAPSEFPSSPDEIRTEFGDLSEKLKLRDAIEYCTGLLQREEVREGIVESKAFSLIGNTTITVTLVIGLGGLLGNLAMNKFDLTVTVLAVFYFFVVLSFVITILLALNVVKTETSAYPGANDIFDLVKKSLPIVQLERAASLFQSFRANHKVVDRKAQYLTCAQVWFRNSVVLLVLAAALLFIYALSGVPHGTVPHTPTHPPKCRLTRGTDK